MTMPAPIGWFPDLATAEAYFENERLETTEWDALADGSVTGEKNQKLAVLNMAYNRIFYDRELEVPNYTDATAEELACLQKAQCEMAYYLAGHLADEDRRKGLEAQGVTQSRVVGELYGTTSDIAGHELHLLPIPPIVMNMLDPFRRFNVPLYAANIDRDEDKGVGTDPTRI